MQKNAFYNDLLHLYRILCMDILKEILFYVVIYDVYELSVCPCRMISRLSLISSWGASSRQNSLRRDQRGVFLSCISPDGRPLPPPRYQRSARSRTRRPGETGSNAADKHSAVNAKDTDHVRKQGFEERERAREMFLEREKKLWWIS